jgi:hypothetical protein
MPSRIQRCSRIAISALTCAAPAIAQQGAKIDTVDKYKSTIVVTPASVPADGSSSATITVTLRNARGDAVAGTSVHLDQVLDGICGSSAECSRISPSSSSGASHGIGRSDASGVVTFTVTSTHPQSADYVPTSQIANGMNWLDLTPPRATRPRVTFTAVAATAPPSGSAQSGGKDWAATAEAFRGKTGQRYTYICPARGDLGLVHGTGTYTDDSSVCTAAVHAGLITRGAGGTVTIEIHVGAAAYEGSSRNGISSQAHAAARGSFVFVTGT